MKIWNILCVLLCMCVVSNVFAGENTMPKSGKKVERNEARKGGVQIGTISSGSSSGGVSQNITITGADVRVDKGSVQIGVLDEETAKTNPEQNINVKDLKVQVEGKTVRINSAEDLKKLNEGRLDELEVDESDD